MEKMNLSIEERIVESGLFYFDDGYLGSTNHCVCYYYGYNKKDINNIKDENNLKSILLDKDYWSDMENDKLGSWDELWNMWFSDCNDFEIIEDNINGGNGYGKIVVNKINKSIEIMVVPCLYSNWGSDKESDIKIFGFDWENGKLVREISEEKLNEILEDKDYYIG